MLRTLLLPAALGAVIQVTSLAQNSEGPQKEVSEKVSEGFDRLRELTEQEVPNFPAALALINRLLPTAKPESYELMLLNQTKVQVLLSMTKFKECIGPMETALRLGRTYNFMEKRLYLEFNQILSQLYFQEATTIVGSTPQDQRQRNDFLAKAYQAIKVYLNENEKPSVESFAYAASMIYTQATLDDATTDMALMNEAHQLAQEGILMTLKPRETFYVLILAALQQNNKNEEAVDILELLVRQKPTEKNYWDQLYATYLNLANDSPEDSAEQFAYYIRTILTIERAQKLGFLNTPAEHFKRVGILMNISQFEQAIHYLEEGLANGDIEAMQSNYEYLATSYQQVHQEAKAIEVLARATLKYPTQGELDYRIAIIQFQLDKRAEAYASGKHALSKGNLEARADVLNFVAYLGYDLKKFDEALPFAQEAVRGGNTNAENLLNAINKAIEERQAALEATI